MVADMQENRIDIKENYIYKLDNELLEILLKDRSSKKNIIWATDNYVHKGFGYQSSDEITIMAITGHNGGVVKPRTEKSKKEFEAHFYGKEGKKLEIHSKEEVDEILKNIEKAEYIVEDIKKSEKKRNPAPPFTTSTMQQEASRKLNFAIRKTMQVAQRFI